MASESAPDDDPEAVDKMLGAILASRYQIESLLGEGAMGAVYKARHVKVGRPFAVKVLHKKLLEDRKVAQRFEREAELAGRLRHPNVIGVVDVGETPDGVNYMVMDFAQGMDLATLLGEAPMPPDRIINLTRQMLEGLYHAHEQGLIHRDFKPENVIVERDDHDTEVPRIVDFGIAILREGGESAGGAGRLTTNGLVLGTPHYMAPEQAVADPIDHRIDLFALGIVIYEMLCGKLPFDGTGAEVARANLLLDPPLIAQRVPYLEVDPLLEAFSRRLMAKKREQRPATAKAARELLDLITNDRAAAAEALGVPNISSTRSPAITQPVPPQGREQPAGELASAASARMLRAADLEAPAVQPSIAVAKPAKGSQATIDTDPAEPLVYGARSRRRTWVFAGLGAFSVAAILTVIVIKSAGNEPTKVAVSEPPKVIIEPTPPVPTVSPNVVTPVEPAGSAVEPSGSAVEPSGSAEKPRNTTVRIKQPKVKPTGGSNVLATGSNSKPIATGSGAQPEVAVAKPVIDAAALYGLYGSVGHDILVVRQVQGSTAASSFEARYSLIHIQDATTTPAKRQAAEAQLLQMRAALAPLKKKP